nr:hypothetical protein GTC16762_07230 [Pigmentibacter ruber]
MNENRSFEDIFSSLQKLAEMREQEEGFFRRNPKTKCVCGRNDLISQQSEEFIDNEDLESNQTKEPIYIQKNQLNFKFAVCPACNPRIDCKMCEGTGHRFLNKVHVYETDDGETEEHLVEELSPNSCACMHTEHLVNLLNNADIPCKYMDADFINIKDEHLNPNQEKKLTENIQKIHLFCKQVAIKKLDIYDKDLKYFVTLFGPVGSGKTLLAISALKMLIIDFGFSGKFVDFQFLLNQLKAEYEQNKSGEEILKKLRNVDILVIDELGKGRNENEWQLEKLDDLINSRYNARKVTILTTNYLPPMYKYEEKEIPRNPNRETSNYWGQEINNGKNQNIPIHESFWNQTLLERLGARMYERIYEVSEFIDFTGLPSFRKHIGKSFLNIYSSNQT